MNLELYKKKKMQMAATQTRFREKCQHCWQPKSSCFCTPLKTVDSNIKFVILTHPAEARKRIATGRLAFAHLKDSEFYRGYNFQNHKAVNRWINDPLTLSYVLYPGLEAKDINTMNRETQISLFPKDQKLVIFVMDGTWSNTSKMFRLSPNLQALPQIRFSPDSPSRFRVRKQPKPHCLSTIEAIHHIIEKLSPSRRGSTCNRHHDHLLMVFDKLINHQIELIKQHKNPLPPGCEA